MFESDDRVTTARVIPLVALILASSAASVAHADDPQPAQINYTVEYSSDYVSVMPGYAVPSKSYGTTGSGFTLSGIYGHQFASHWAVEGNVQGSVFETGVNRGTDFYESGVTGDLVYLLRDRHAELLTPFVLVGVGGVYDDFYPNTRDGAAFIANAGVGLVTQPLFSNGIRLRLDARYVYDAKEGGHEGYRFIAGIDIPLGRVQHEVVTLPGKVEVREVIREVTREVPRPWKDSDGDGVDDDHDLCPGTPHGLKVDAHGCALENQTLGLQGVTFEFNRARLTTNAMTILDGVAHAFSGQPSMKAEVAGHTDGLGSAAANLHLSQQRAEAVRSYLIRKGVRAEQLTARGYGKSQPLASPERSDDDRERNRRVELRVLAR